MPSHTPTPSRRALSFLFIPLLTSSLHGTVEGGVPLAATTTVLTTTATYWWWWLTGDEAVHEEFDAQVQKRLLLWHEHSSEDGDEECNFWNGSYEWSLELCSHYAISRLGKRVEQEALQRAVQCASRHSTDCVLAPEIGVGLPAVFVYDSSDGMRLLMAPRLLPASTPSVGGGDDLRPASESVAVRVHDPKGGNHRLIRSMRREIRVEFFTTDTKVLQVETLRDEDAFCVQLARRAISHACWDALD
jgi:hypothetical protein